MKVYLESYGCTLNHGEARYMLDLLSVKGHERVYEPDKADINILFTCTVIKTTERSMLRRVQFFTNYDKPLIVSGCMAVIQSGDIRKINPRAVFIQPKEISKINELIEKISDKAEVKIKPVSKEKRVKSKTGESIDSIIPISTGCRGQCTYCITRLARGTLSSYSVNEILSRATAAINHGLYEIRLTAQDTACYGYNSTGNLAKLLTQLVGIDTEHDYRVRVGMMNPDSVKPILSELIESYKHKRIFKFLHVPVQTGSDELLRAMGRKYTVSEFFFIIDKFRKSFPELTISTDIIVGYPDETEEQFQHSMNLLGRLRPNIVNITRFSARPGTPAAKLKNTNPGATIKARSRLMTKLRFKISKELNDRTIGKKYKVLVTESVKAGSVLGRTDNYQPVVIKNALALGSWVWVEVTDATDSYLVGEIVN